MDDVKKIVKKAQKHLESAVMGLGEAGKISEEDAWKFRELQMDIKQVLEAMDVILEG